MALIVKNKKNMKKTSSKIKEKALEPIISQMKNELCTAIIEITQRVDSILNVAELIGGLSQSLPPEVSKTITEYTTHLFEASALQDTIAQRLTKVIRLLKDLDSDLTEEDVSL